MDTTLLYIIISLLLAASALMLMDYPYIGGSVLASGAGERIFIRVTAPFLLIAAIVLPCFYPEYFTQMTEGLLSPKSVANILPVGMATALSSAIMWKLSRFVAVPFAFIAAIAGLGLANGDTITFKESMPYILSWIAAPLFCAFISATFYLLFALMQRGGKNHFAKTEARMLSLSTIVALLLIPAAGLNNSMIFTYLPSEYGSLTPYIAGGAVIVLMPLVARSINRDKWDIADYELDTNPQSILSLMMGLLVCFALFSSPLPQYVGLRATPLPAGTLFIAALAGISIFSKRTLTEGPEIIKGIITTYLSPILALLLSFCLGKILDREILGTIIVLGIFLTVGGVMFFVRRQNKSNLNKQILRSQQQRYYSTQKSLSALEVRAEMTEKDLLNKLENKRKELVDFAMGISEQKNYMESVFDQLKMVRSTKDGAEKDARTEELLKSLHDRMYFTREMNDFYSRSEELHKDFNMRLMEAFPHLTENERKLATLLRQGFSSKYIASLMSITPKSVEINRYRLRSKLGLRRSDNLITFIKSI